MLLSFRVNKSGVLFVVVDEGGVSLSGEMGDERVDKIEIHFFCSFL